MTQQPKEELQTILTNVNDTYLPVIERQLEERKIDFSEYQRKCVMNALGAINEILDTKSISWRDSQLDQSNITQMLLEVASLELNCVAIPRECFFTLRNAGKKVKVKGDDGKEKEITIWKKKFELGIEGAGNDTIVARFGRNVKKVYPFWEVREGDDFTYPTFNGVNQTPPIWTQKGTGKVIRIVYPVLDNDDIVHYYIAEREDVRKNLVAHIKNNLMNETFGVCKDRYNATNEQLKKVAEIKKGYLDKLKSMTKIDEILDADDFTKWISPAWKEDFSREAMIIRKMRNNALKTIPRDFSNAFSSEVYHRVTDESYRDIKEVIEVNTATKEIGINEDEPIMEGEIVEGIVEGIEKPDFI